MELADGTMIVADDEYLIRAIKKPNADLRAGYPVQMPRNNLNDRQIADIVTYINDLVYVTPGRMTVSSAVSATREQLG